MEIKNYLVNNGGKVWNCGDKERVYINTNNFCTVDFDGKVVVNGIDFSHCNLYIIRNIKAIANGSSFCKFYFDVKDNSFNFSAGSEPEKKLLNNICDTIRNNAKNA